MSGTLVIAVCVVIETCHHVRYACDCRLCCYWDLSPCPVRLWLPSVLLLRLVAMSGTLVIAVCVVIETCHPVLYACDGLCVVIETCHHVRYTCDCRLCCHWDLSPCPVRLWLPSVLSLRLVTMSGTLVIAVCVVIETCHHVRYACDCRLCCYWDLSPCPVRLWLPSVLLLRLVTMSCTLVIAVCVVIETCHPVLYACDCRLCCYSDLSPCPVRLWLPSVLLLRLVTMSGTLVIAVCVVIETCHPVRYACDSRLCCHWDLSPCLVRLWLPSVLLLRLVTMSGTLVIAVCVVIETCHHVRYACDSRLCCHWDLSPCLVRLWLPSVLLLRLVTMSGTLVIAVCVVIETCHHVRYACDCHLCCYWDLSPCPVRLWLPSVLLLRLVTMSGTLVIAVCVVAIDGWCGSFCSEHWLHYVSVCSSLFPACCVCLDTGDFLDVMIDAYPLLMCCFLPVT